MTTIVGVQGNGWALIAADSKLVYGTQPFYAKQMDKVVKRGEYVFAFAGDAMAGDIANHLWVPPKVSKSLDPDTFLMFKLLPSLREAFTSAGYDPKQESKKDDGGFDALVSFSGRIYQITSDYAWMRDDNKLFGVGSGGSYALGALSAMKASTKSIKMATQVAKRAIQISSQYDIYTGGEVKVITTKEQ